MMPRDPLPLTERLRQRADWLDEHTLTPTESIALLREAADQIERLTAERDEAREVLGFYADSQRYRSTNQSMMGSAYPAIPTRPEICHDAGASARALLAQLTQEE